MRFKCTLAALLVSAFVMAQSIFTNPITGTNPNTANPYTTGQTVDPNITVSGIGRGSAITGTNANDRYNASDWNTSATLDVNDYFEFVITPNTGYTIDFVSFVYTGQRSSSGPNSFSMRSSADGFSSDIGAPTATGTTISLTASSYQQVSSAIRFRVYGWAASAAGGTFSINDFTFNGTVNLAGKVSTGNGDWNVASTWNPSGVPTATDRVTIQPGHTVFTNTSLTRSTTTTVNGSFELRAGGFASGTNFTYGASGSLRFDPGVGNNYGVDNSHVYWPSANGPYNVIITSGGITMNGMNRTVGGIFSIGGTNAGVYIPTGSVLRINGTGIIEAGGFFGNSPIYGNASTLQYNSGGTYGRGYEWFANGMGTIGTTPGYPNNVILGNSTTLDYNNGAGTAGAKAMYGNLTIDSGSSFYMDYGPNPNNGALTVNGNVLNNGNFTLGDASGDDLVLFGNFTNNGTFNGNNRAIVFSRNGSTQDVNSAATLTIPYLNFGSTGSRTVVLNANVNVTAPLTGNAISFSSASDVIYLNDRTMTIGTTGVANQIAGLGIFRGSTNSTVTLLGSGNIGTMTFGGTGGQVLSSFTVNRTAAATAVQLGSSLQINNNLTLTNGLIDLGGQTMTLMSGVPPSLSGSTASYVISDLTSGGNLRRQISASGTYNYPIGDRVASADGSQFTPASVTFPAGVSGYFGVRVEDDMNPNFDGSQYITRYWSCMRSGTFPSSGGYSFTGNYVASDIVGTESAMLSNLWNGTIWTAGTVSPANTVTYSAGSAFVNNTEFTRGLRSPEIQIQVGATTYATGSTYNFGTVLTTASNSVTFTIYNLGQQTLTLSPATFTGTPNYTYTTTYGTSVTGASTATFVVTFNPTVAGTLTGSISIPNNDPTGSETPYVINFTGIGQIPAPEIRVETASASEIPSGSPANNGYTTIFAAQNIGATAGPRTFRINNVGTANLNVSSITVTGAHPGDFVVTASAPYNIAASGVVNFTITFTPSAFGTRTATIVIANNDSDENPYTFDVQGTGDCATIPTTVTPASGPVGTELTITATSNNLNGATISFNGVAATSVTQVSATQIVVIVPAGATSGPILTTNSQGCQATTTFQLITTHIASCQGTMSGQPSYPTQLFISEVTDSNYGSLTYVEIYNPTAGAINLSTYSIQVANNGAGYSHTVPLSGSVAAGGVHVVALGRTPSTNCSIPGGDGSFATTSSTQGSVNFGNNDDDHIALFQNATSIDHWGIYGDANWAPNSIGANGVVFRRKVLGTVLPTTSYNDNDWDIIDIAGNGVGFCGNNDYSGIGNYDFSRGIPPTVTQHPAASPSCKDLTLTVAGTEGFAGGNPLAYQWYAVAPGASAWTPLSDNAVYSGTTSVTLIIANVSGLAGYQFYCQIRENLDTCFAASNAVKIDGFQTVTWNGSAWTPPSGPNANTAVTMNGNYDTTTWGDFSACSLTVASGTLTVSPGHFVTVVNDLTVNTGASMNIGDDGSLIMVSDSGVVTNNGTMTMQRNPNPFQRYDYTYWSSPIANGNLATVFSGWRTDYAFTFNTANFSDISPLDGFDDDGNAWTNASGLLQPGKGYAIMGATNAPSYPIAPPVIFSGRYNNGVISQNLSLSGNPADPNDDFNLIGNPYPSALQANEFIGANTNISGTLYFWTHSSQISVSNPGNQTYNFITSDYATYTTGGGVASSNGGLAPSGNIASGQGFFVEAITATPVIFNNSMRDVSANNTRFFRIAQPQEIRDRVWLNFTQDTGLFSQQLVVYTDQATLGYDRGYDGRVSKSVNTVSFYSLLDEENMRIQCRPAFDSSDVVPLGYSTGYASEYKIAIDHSEGVFAAGQIVYLEDKQLNVVHDLTEGPYTFSTEAGAFDSRFQLRYQLPLSVGEKDPKNNLMVTSGKGWFEIRADKEMESVELIDLLGRKLFVSSGVSSDVFRADLPQFADSVVVIVVKFREESQKIVKIRM